MGDGDTETNSNTGQSKIYHHTIEPGKPITFAPKFESSLLDSTIVKPKKRPLQQLDHK